MTARDRLVVVVLLAVAVVAASWLLLLSPRRHDVASLQDQVTVADARLASAQAGLRASSNARAEYASDYATVVRLGKAVPSDDDLDSLVVQLQDAAKRSGVRFSAITRTAGDPAAAPAAAAAAAPATTTGTTATTATTPAAPATAAAPAAAGATGALPPGVTVGAAGLGVLPLDVTFKGRYLPLQELMRRLADLTRVTPNGVSVRGRLLTVDGFELAPADSGLPRLIATVHMTAYVLPASEGLTGAEVPGAMTGTPLSGTSTPSTTAPVTGEPTVTASIR